MIREKHSFLSEAGADVFYLSTLGSWTGWKWATRRAEAENICWIGCGRPAQEDYGWKGPAFNCCLGTVACLVEHKRPVRHASATQTCECLADQWNAPLFPRCPPKKSWPLYSPYILLWALCFYSSGLTGRHAHARVHSSEWCNDKDWLLVSLLVGWKEHMWSTYDQLKSGIFIWAPRTR